MAHDHAALGVLIGTGAVCVVGVLLLALWDLRRSGRFDWNTQIGLVVIASLSFPPLILNALGLFSNAWAWAVVVALFLTGLIWWGNHAKSLYGRFDAQARLGILLVGGAAGLIFGSLVLEQVLGERSLNALLRVFCGVIALLSFIWLCWMRGYLLHISRWEQMALSALLFWLAAVPLAQAIGISFGAGWLLWSTVAGAILAQIRLLTWRYLFYATRTQCQKTLWQKPLRGAQEVGCAEPLHLMSRTSTVLRTPPEQVNNQLKNHVETKEKIGMTKMSPTQQEAFEDLLRVYSTGHIGVLYGVSGMGKSTVLRALQASVGGTLLTMRNYLDALKARHPLALEESFEHMVLDALKNADCVLVDDLHLLSNVADCNHFYNRRGLIHAPLAALAAYTVQSGKKLVFVTEGSAPAPIHERCYYTGIGEFKVADYEFLSQVYLGPTLARGLDHQRIHRFAPKLNAHQIKGACEWLKGETDLNTERFIDYLRSQHMTSNVSLREVREVNLHDLKGVDDVIASLEANIIMPLENDDLASELNLKPRRGVLLVGPPGTGKTTIGRALAHRLKSKFFLIDGTFISGSQNFYAQVHEVFEAAKQNAPSIIFVDDSDAIFESGEELGLYRYLLTMLDGLESESAGGVCVMMTAMNVGHLPPALIRSGRIELWLETRLPDEEARAAILQAHLEKLPKAIGSVDVERVVAASDGFTGADLHRLMEDGKTLFAYDKARRQPLQSPTMYFLAAVETVRVNKERYAEAEAQARQQRPARPAFYDFFPGMGVGPQ